MIQREMLYLVRKWYWNHHLFPGFFKPNDIRGLTYLEPKGSMFWDNPNLHFFHVTSGAIHLILGHNPEPLLTLDILITWSILWRWHKIRGPYGRQSNHTKAGRGTYPALPITSVSSTPYLRYNLVLSLVARHTAQHLLQVYRWLVN